MGAYDGMKVIYEGVAKLGGDLAGDKFIEAIKGIAFESPRGPVKIDPQPRDIVQTIYIRKTEKVGGALRNVEFQRYADTRDPGK